MKAEAQRLLDTAVPVGHAQGAQLVGICSETQAALTGRCPWQDIYKGLSWWASAVGHAQVALAGGRPLAGHTLGAWDGRHLPRLCVVVQSWVCLNAPLCSPLTYGFLSSDKSDVFQGLRQSSSSTKHIINDVDRATRTAV